MKKPIFLKITSVSSTLAIFPCTGQTYLNRSGNVEKVDAQKQVTHKMGNALKIAEGEIYATDNLQKHPKGWYVVDSLTKVTDNNGVVVDDGGNPEMEFMIKEYIAFSTGEQPEIGENGEKIFTLVQQLRMDEFLAPPTIEDDGWYVDKDLWYHLIRNFKKQKNTLLIGNSGAGKTDLIQIMMDQLGKRLNIFDMAISNPNKVLCGNLRAENGTTHYQYARFATEIQKKGMVLLDEIPRANPTANNILLPVCDKRRTLYIEDAIDEVEIKLHPECTIFASANIGTQFIGTSALDHALLNRFHQVGVEYPPADKEIELLKKVHGLPEKQAMALVKFVTDVRDAEDLSKDISTRQLMEIGELIKDGYSAKEAVTWSVLYQFETDKGDGGERQTVLSIMQSL